MSRNSKQMDKMNRALRASRQACLAVLVCVGSTACVTDPEDTEGVSGALLFENALDPDRVGGTVKDYTGDGEPDLFMVVRPESGESAAAILTTDSGGEYRFLVKTLESGDVATPELALTGTEVSRSPGPGSAEELLARLEGLRDVVDALPPAQRTALGLNGSTGVARHSVSDCEGTNYCGWEHPYYGGGYWWVPWNYGVANLGNWGWNDRTSHVRNQTNIHKRISDNCNGCSTGAWEPSPPGDDHNFCYQAIGGNYVCQWWDNRITALYTAPEHGTGCWDDSGRSCGF